MPRGHFDAPRRGRLPLDEAGSVMMCARVPVPLAEAVDATGRKRSEVVREALEDWISRLPSLGHPAGPLATPDPEGSGTC